MVTETLAISPECVIQLLERQLQVRSQINEHVTWGPRSIPGVDTGLQSPLLPFPRGLGREFVEAGVAQMWTALSLLVVVGTGPLSPDIFPWTLREPFLFHHSSIFLGETPSRSTSPQIFQGLIFKILSNLPSVTRCPDKTYVEMFCPHLTDRKLRLSAEECRE